MSIRKARDGIWEIRWREGGRHKTQWVHGSHELAKKIERKRLSLRDENRHLDIKREVNLPMRKLVDRYEEEYSKHKKSYERERSILENIRKQLGGCFVREVDGPMLQAWYRGIMGAGRCPGTALKYFNVVHHMMKKAATIWSKETGIDRSPADLVEVIRLDDSRERYLSAEEMQRLKTALDTKLYRLGTKDFNRTFYRLRVIVLIALTTGMRMGEIFDLTWSDVRYREGLIAVRSKLKGGRIRYVPMTAELAAELRKYPAVLGEQQLFPPRTPTKGERQRVEHSFATILKLAGITNCRFHDLRHTFASWYMMNGGDLYELAKILGHSNIRMTERYAKLGKTHIARTSDTAREMWKLMERSQPAQEAV